MRTRDTRRRESKVENRDQLTTNRWFVNKKKLASSKRNRNSILDSKRKKKKKNNTRFDKKKILAPYFVIIAIFQNYQLSLNLHYQIIFSNKIYYII